MDDSVCAFAEQLMAEAKAREGVLREENRTNIPEEEEEEDEKEEESLIEVKGQAEDEMIESAPTTPSNNKENTAAPILPDEDEEMEEENEEEEMDREQNDEIGRLKNSKFSRTLAATSASASPVSRKSRLSALAQSINSWEDDLGTPCSRQVSTAPPPITNTTRSTTRFSVSTPPPTNRLAAAQKKVSCHQFIAAASSVPQQRSRSVSPTKKLTPRSKSPFEASVSPAKASTPVTKEMSPAKISFISSPQKNSPAIASPQKVESPIRQFQKSRSVSPIKQLQQTPKYLIKEDKFEKNLELQGFVKIQSERPSSVKKEVSFMSKKRMFETASASSDPSLVPTAPKIPKPASAWQTPVAQKRPEPEPVTTLTPLQQFHSRKSLAIDPSELSVAQKAKLFEKQQQEQEKLKAKEQEANQRLNVRRFVNKNVAPPVSITMSPEKKKEPEQKETAKSKPPPPTFYFGQESAASPASIPPPPPLPPTNCSPEKEHSPVKLFQGKEEEDEEEEKISSSFLIAKSVKRIKVVHKEDKMYPSLTDIETTEAEEEDEEEGTDTDNLETSAQDSLNSSMSTSSLGSFIQSRATKPVGEMNTTMACRKIDELIDQALEGQDGIDDDTFMMESAVPVQTSSPIVKKQQQPLMHTVSLYRKKQQQMKKSEDEVFKTPTSLKTLAEQEEEDEGEKVEIHDKIQTLEQAVLIQQKAIAQASKALNVCESSFEFNNSTENVEGERVLLIASQKRSQLLLFINKLRHGKKDEDNLLLSPSKDKFKPSSSIRGSMRIDNIQLYPVKSARLHQDYVYHLIVILKHNETVLATSTVKTSASNTMIEFPNDFTIPEMDPSFKIQVEVYALRTFKQIDVIPHNMKYHIKNPTASSGSCSTPSKGSTLSHFLTPSKSSSKHTPKATDLKSSARPSSASSNSIRSSNFTLQGVLNLDLSNLNKNEWELSLVSTALILPNISMRIKCSTKNELNYKGFLTVFSDVSGLGAWHRRYAMLDKDYRLIFWTYPEDEAQDKPPCLTLDLSSCITPRISPTSREVCARPNTFLLVTTREPLPTDKDSLVVSVHEKYTAIKNMFSADNRMERDEWIGVINKALTNMRAWGISGSTD